MPRVRIGPALPGREQLDVEITRLRDLDVGGLRNRWQAVFGRPAPAHLPRHLLLRVVAYRLQADRFGDLDSESTRLLDHSGSPEKAGQSAVTVLGREWNGQMQRVTVIADVSRTKPNCSMLACSLRICAGGCLRFSRPRGFRVSTPTRFGFEIAGNGKAVPAQHGRRFNQTFALVGLGSLSAFVHFRLPPSRRNGRGLRMRSVCRHFLGVANCRFCRSLSIDKFRQDRVTRLPGGIARDFVLLRNLSLKHGL
jgi:DUF2924 family protein